jgi:hypothetical protein
MNYSANGINTQLNTNFNFQKLNSLLKAQKNKKRRKNQLRKVLRNLQRSHCSQGKRDCY